MHIGTRGGRLGVGHIHMEVPGTFRAALVVLTRQALRRAVAVIVNVHLPPRQHPVTLDVRVMVVFTAGVTRERDDLAAESADGHLQHHQQEGQQGCHGAVRAHASG